MQPLDVSRSASNKMQARLFIPESYFFFHLQQILSVQILGIPWICGRSGYRGAMNEVRRASHAQSH